MISIPNHELTYLNNILNMLQLQYDNYTSTLSIELGLARRKFRSLQSIEELELGDLIGLERLLKRVCAHLNEVDDFPVHFILSESREALAIVDGWKAKMK